MLPEEMAFFTAQVTTNRTGHTCLNCKGTSQFESHHKRKNSYQSSTVFEERQGWSCPRVMSLLLDTTEL